MLKKYFMFFILIAVSFVLAVALKPVFHKKNSRLYWFIPDGMRADPGIFNVFQWADEGLLPNIKKMMSRGTYGFCKPVYPGHTPVNFATLFTGSYPEVHKVSDGPMHEEGKPLSSVAVGGFSSVAKKVDPIWLTLENGGARVGLLSIPGSTPPELKNGYTMVGRWGGWGASFHAVNFEEKGSGERQFNLGSSKRLFFFGPPLLIFAESSETEDYPGELKTFSAVRRAGLSAWGATVSGCIYDSTDDGTVNYDRMAFSTDGKTVSVDLKQGQWSEWLPIKLLWHDKKTDTSAEIDTVFKIKVTKLDGKGFFAVRFYYNAMNETLTDPGYIASDMIENVGPMVDFVDNFPPQLIYYPEDRNTFLEEADMSFDWHTRACSYFIDTYRPDVFIHDIYTPNQMLTSRWWMGYIDPDSPFYNEVGDKERDRLWAEVKDMYRKLDRIIGVYLKKARKNDVVVLSSDHGAAPLHTWVHVNNLFASKGWLKCRQDRESGEYIIDWEKSKAVYLKFGHVYVNPAGLHNSEGRWERGSGPEYIRFREEVAESVRNLRDSRNAAPLAKICSWEDAEKEFRLPHERSGDLLISNVPGYGWSETMTPDRILFSRPLKTGYKQAIICENSPCMWTPFIIVGPDIKQDNFLKDDLLSMTDQYPTIMKALGRECPGFVQGKVIRKAFLKEDN
ncbi:MAG: alkaline phosphatase family protein [Elusimicrobia bacterium]|nr:alkaline phosphatase family protein [Elusimicrobiota bacterium]